MRLQDKKTQKNTQKWRCTMVNGLTWTEETKARLKQAREKQKQAEERSRLEELEAKSYKTYADALENVLKVIGEQDDGQHPLDPERLRKQSVINSMAEIASANNGLLVVVDAIPIFIDARIFGDREHASHSIYSNLYHYKKRFKKERKGVYRLIDAQRSLLK